MKYTSLAWLVLPHSFPFPLPYLFPHGFEFFRHKFNGNVAAIEVDSRFDLAFLIDVSIFRIHPYSVTEVSRGYDIMHPPFRISPSRSHARIQLSLRAPRAYHRFPTALSMRYTGFRVISSTSRSSSTIPFYDCGCSRVGGVHIYGRIKIEIHRDLCTGVGGRPSPYPSGDVTNRVIIPDWVDSGA